METALSIKPSAPLLKKPDFAKYKERCRHSPSIAKKDAIRWMDWVFSFSDPEKGALPQEDRHRIHELATLLAQMDSKGKEFDLFVDSASILGTFYCTNSERLEDIGAFARLTKMNNFLSMFPSSIHLVHAIMSRSRCHEDVSDGLNSIERLIGMDMPGRQFAKSVMNLVSNGDRRSIVQSMGILSKIPPASYTPETIDLMENITKNAWGFTAVCCLEKLSEMMLNGGLPDAEARSLATRANDTHGSSIEKLLQQAAEKQQ
jgi:hypothetical protein